MGRKVRFKDRMIPMLMYLTPEQIKYLERNVNKKDSDKRSKTALVRLLIDDAMRGEE